MFKTYLAIAFFIAGFLAENAYGEMSAESNKVIEALKALAKDAPSVPKKDAPPVLKEKIPWSEQKAKELGIPAIADGTIVMCEGKESTGFNWDKGKYIKVNFKVGKELYKKVEPDRYCLGWKRLTAEEKLGFIKPNSTYMDFSLLFNPFGIRKGCYNVYPFGEEPGPTSTVCTERYEKKDDKTWEAQISCDSGVSLKGDTSLSPNGLFHRFKTHSNLSQTDKTKFSLFIEWGKCATLFSP
jgi:hypothetical protein